MADLQETVEEFLIEARALLDLPETINQKALEKITLIGDTYASVIASQVVNFWVDQENGDDGNEGSLASPLKDIQTAINLAPRGGSARIVLTNDYHLSQDIDFAGRHVEIRSEGLIERRITTEPYQIPTNPITRDIYGFRMSNGSIYLEDMALVMPELGTWGQYDLLNGGFFNSRASEGWGSLKVSTSRCKFEIPAIPFSWYFSDQNTITFFSFAATFPGAITNPAGRIFHAQPNTAGVLANTLPWLQTNLTTV